MTIIKKNKYSSMKDEVMPAASDTRTGLSNAALKQAVLDHLLYSIGRVPAVAPDHTYYKALSLTGRFVNIAKRFGRYDL